MNLNHPGLVRIPQHGCVGDKVKSRKLSGEAAALGIGEDGHLDATIVHQGARQLSFLGGDQFTFFESAQESCLEVRIDVCNLQGFIDGENERMSASIVSFLQTRVCTLFPDNLPSSSTLPTTTPPPRMIWG